MKINLSTFLFFLGLLLLTVVAKSERIVDITHLFHDNMPVFDKKEGAGSIINETMGRALVTGVIRVGTHYGTHVDSPSHLKDLFPLGKDIPSLNLETLIGPVLVVRIANEVNITGAVLRSLLLSHEVERVIFKTVNTDRCLMYQRAFVSDYTGFTADGAQWLVENTKIKLVGIDYMSISRYDDIVVVHQTLLNNTVPVECLNLYLVDPGWYTVYCLPLKAKSEGAPTRCILLQHENKRRRKIM